MSDDDEKEFTVSELLDQFDIAYPRLPPVKREEIGGLDDVIEQLSTFERAVQHPEMFEIYGVRPSRGAIFYGPPGTGKTYLARYLSQGLGARFMDVPLTSFESKWVGQAAAQIKQIIGHARLYFQITGESVFVFMDEAEESLKDRNAMGWHAPRVNAILREMDGLSGDNKGIYFGAATNHLEKVDSAVLRPGRLDFQIKVGDYSAEGLADVVRACSVRANNSAVKGFDPYQLSQADMTELGSYAKRKGFTPAHIASAFRKAADEKIKYCLDRDDIMNKEETLIYAANIMDALKLMKGVESMEKRPVGYGRW